MDLVEQHTANGKRHPWELARFEILFGLIRQALPVSETPKVIVDIGCGDAWFAGELLARLPGTLVIGIEPAYTPEEVVAKEKEMGHPQFRLFRQLEEAERFLTGQPADLLLLLDVVEHVEKDTSFLQGLQISGLTGAQTAVLISVPAFQGLFTTHDLFLKHYRRYSRRAISQTAAAAGLKPVQSGYFFHALLPLRLLQKWGEALGRKKTPAGIGQWKAPDWITRLLTHCLLLDYRVSRILNKAGLQLPGLSAFCLCKKSVS